MTRVWDRAIPMSSGVGSLVLAWAVPLGLPWGLEPHTSCRPGGLPSPSPSPLGCCVLRRVWLALTPSTRCSPLSVYTRFSPTGWPWRATPQVWSDRGGADSGAAGQGWRLCSWSSLSAGGAQGPLHSD